MRSSTLGAKWEDLSSVKVTEDDLSVCKHNKRADVEISCLCNLSNEGLCKAPVHDPQDKQLESKVDKDVSMSDSEKNTSAMQRMIYKGMETDIVARPIITTEHVQTQRMAFSKIQYGSSLKTSQECLLISAALLNHSSAAALRLARMYMTHISSKHLKLSVAEPKPGSLALVCEPPVTAVTRENLEGISQKISLGFEGCVARRAIQALGLLQGGPENDESGFESECVKCSQPTGAVNQDQQSGWRGEGSGLSEAAQSQTLCLTESPSLAMRYQKAAEETSSDKRKSSEKSTSSHRNGNLSVLKQLWEQPLETPTSPESRAHSRLQENHPLPPVERRPVAPYLLEDTEQQMENRDAETLIERPSVPLNSLKMMFEKGETPHGSRFNQLPTPPHQFSPPPLGPSCCWQENTTMLTLWDVLVSTRLESVGVELQLVLLWKESQTRSDLADTENRSHGGKQKENVPPVSADVCSEANTMKSPAPDRNGSVLSPEQIQLKSAVTLTVWTDRCCKYCPGTMEDPRSPSPSQVHPIKMQGRPEMVEGAYCCLSSSCWSSTGDNRQQQWKGLNLWRMIKETKQEILTFFRIR
ncbi:hypothetical protein DNTS_015586 [Danionella cerebrum]|uniref:Uncharacterized protein n=1 Tax=Danionella cerebrum TaxID=2873325 RepID=A0A553R1R6_9TELE|nr:hypothetical protein DNTS_015586 [Danionella translucida]